MAESSHRRVHNQLDQQDCADCATACEKIRRRDFPVASADIRIPWALAETAYMEYVKEGGRGQSLEVVALRGGFYTEELDAWIPGWRPAGRAIRELETQRDQLLHVVRQRAKLDEGGTERSILRELGLSTEGP